MTKAKKPATPPTAGNPRLHSVATAPAVPAEMILTAAERRLIIAIRTMDLRRADNVLYYAAWIATKYPRTKAPQLRVISVDGRQA